METLRSLMFWIGVKSHKNVSYLRFCIFKNIYSKWPAFSLEISLLLSSRLNSTTRKTKFTMLLCRHRNWSFLRIPFWFRSREMSFGSFQLSESTAKRKQSPIPRKQKAARLKRTYFNSISTPVKRNSNFWVSLQKQLTFLRKSTNLDKENARSCWRI